MFFQNELTNTSDLARQEALLQIYLKHESPDRQKFKSFLQGLTADLARSRHRHDYKVFISYAWERGDELVKQQNWLRLLREDLQALGLTVFLDVGDMKGDLTKCMQDNIAAADYILLLGTPWLQQRVADTSTNAALEWRAITEKCKDRPDTLIPLLYKGDFGSSFPPGTLKKLVLDFRDQKEYYTRLTSLGASAGSSLGLIPIILNFRSDETHRTYATLLRVFELELEQVIRDFNLAKESAEKAAQEKAAAKRQEKLQEILIPEEKFTYDLTKKLGEGGFGEVYLGTWGGNQIAVKMVKIATAMSPNAKKDIEDEAIAMASLRNPNIVQIYGVGLRSYALLMEYMPRGSLYNLLHSDAEINEKTKYQIALDVASGLSYLHDRNILHRDLKSLNVLLDSRLRAKLCDFGLAKLKTETRTTTSSESGTTAWMAPELLQPPPKNKPASKSSDVYALGMILFELVSRKIPFAAAGSELVIMSWIMNGVTETVPDEAPPVFKRLMTNCWQPYEQRPAAESVLKELAIEFKGVEEADIAVPVNSALAVRPMSSRSRRLLSPVINADSGLSAQEERARKAEEELALLRAQVAEREIIALKEQEAQITAERQTKEQEERRLPAERKAKEAEESVKAAAAKPLINHAEVAVLLKLVAEGEQEQAEAALKGKRELALGAGNVTDLSGRTFNNITALQYAVWALDWQMWEMIIRYMDRENINTQLSEMETGSWVSTHGATAESLIQNLLTELQVYIDNFDKWNEAKDWTSLEKQWSVKVGTAQRHLPVHVVNEYCHPKEAFHPLPDFKSATRYQSEWRTRKTDQGEWFTAKYKGGSLGSNFAMRRSEWPVARFAKYYQDIPRDAAEDLGAGRCLLVTRLQQQAELIDTYRPTEGLRPGR